MSRLAHGLVALRRRAARTGGAIASLVALDDPAARLLFDGDGQPRVAIDRTGCLAATNAAFAALLGRSPPAGTALVELIAPAGRQAAWREIEAAMARGDAPRGGTAEWRPVEWSRSDGTTQGAAFSAVPVREADGRVSGAVLVLHPSPPAEGRAAAELNARKLQAVGALAGGVAHDFNNLLQAIGAAAEALAERTDLAPEAREAVELVQAGSRRGASLVQQLLAFASQQTLHPQVVAVNDAITALAGLLRRTLGERVRLDLDLETPGRSVRADPGQLDQVLVNLAVNARDAMPQGGVLSLRTGRRTVLKPQANGAETIPPGRYVVIEVADTGQGIAPAILSRIFEPFFTTRAGTGTGLGLSTVMGIVRQSGGFVEVDSRPGAGTVFRVLLPRIADQAAPAAATPVAPQPAPVAALRDMPNARGLVLLVEDEDAVRRLATRALERQGWEVLAAESGEAALARLDPAHAPACVVTDMVMPGIDGAVLVNTLRERLCTPSLPALIVSGYAAPALHEGMGAAATAYLPKPYSMRDLAARVAALTSIPRAVASGAV